MRRLFENMKGGKDSEELRVKSEEWKRKEEIKRERLKVKSGFLGNKSIE